MSVILFDIDKTIFNTPSLFDDKVRPLLAEKYDLSLEESYRLIGDYKASLSRNSDFDPNELIQFISQHIPGSTTKEIETLFYTPESFRQSVFPETKKVLSSLQGKYTLGIFSEAVESWQERKLDLAELTPFFDQELIFIFRRKETIEAMSKLPAGAWVIDDKPEAIEALLEFKKLKPIWINRKQEHMPIAEVVPTIRSLTEVIDIVS